MQYILQDLERRYGQRKSLKGFFEFAGQLPESLEYVEVTYETKPPEYIREKRDTFETHRSDFYRQFAEAHGEDLLAMGISNTAIDRMLQFGYRPKSRLGEVLDISIDHILSLQFGGNNSFRNICLLSGKINHFKNILEQLQINTQEGSNKIITIMPKYINGRRAAVPIIQGGFKPRIKNAGLIKPNTPHQ